MQVDLTVVGAGPTGLYAAYYAGVRGLRTAIVDSLPEPGGQIAAMYPEKQIYDIAGFPAVRGRDLVASLTEQAETAQPRWLLGRCATSLARLEDGSLRIGLPPGTDGQLESITTRSIVIAGGIGTFTPRPLLGGQQFSGRGVDHFVTDPAAYVGEHVLIVGGGDSAVDWALLLEPIAASVTLVHRRAEFRAHASSVAALHASTVQVRTPEVLDALFGRDAPETAVLRGVSTGDVTEINCTKVIAALGFTANLGPLAGWGIRIVERRIAVDSTMWTGVEGVYAAGDITHYPGKVRLISVAFGEAALAVNNAAVAADPRVTLFPGHSTETAA
jgi:ferredoxin/flavodoxin---NADP+ reductase